MNDVNDEQATQVLQIIHAPQFRYWVRRISSVPQEVEDITTETVFQVVRGLGGFRGHCALRSWIYTIARNVALARRKQAVRRSKYEGPLNAVVIACQPGVEHRAEDPEWPRRLALALNRLTGRQRACFCLNVFGGYSYEEVARTLRLTPNCVKSIIHRAREALAADKSLVQP